MRTIASLLVAALLTSFTTAENVLAQQNAGQSLERMVAAIAQNRDLSYELTARERMKDGQTKVSKYLVHVQDGSVYKVWLRVLLPEAEKGTEILYVEGEREGKALVRPGSGLAGFKNWRFAPLHWRMVDGRHNTITDNGFGSLEHLAKSWLSLPPDVFAQRVVLAGETTFEGRECLELEITAPDFSCEPFTIGQDAVTVWELARQKNVSAYQIVANNAFLSHIGEVLKPGTELELPTAAAKNILLLIDLENGLPVRQVYRDGKGVFAEYAYRRLNTKPGFEATEFTEGHRAYGF